MTTTTLLPETTTVETVQTESIRKLPALNVVKSEWIKFWSVRSTSVTLLVAGFVTVIFGMIFSALAESGTAEGPAAGLTNPVDLSLGFVGLTAMIVGVVGVMFVASEYSTGMIRTAYAAVGRRGRVIRAKVAVLGVTVFSVAMVAVTATIVAGQAVYSGSEATTPVTDLWDLILGNSIYLVGIALIGAALGFILRSTAAGIGTLVGGVFIGPNLLNLLPDSITDVFMKYLPSEAGSAIIGQVSNPDQLSQGAAYAVFTGWVVGLLALAGLLVNRRDA
ncbi:MAG: ABC transporter permease [Acidimicrobiales bacterium]|nr:ABC transporter permease [Acidimicrobiales bacterium]